MPFFYIWRLVMNITLEDLVKKLEEYNPKEIEIIKKAYYYAKNLHSGQMRESGEPYITHPLNVAYILADMHADRDTICAGLLHDTLEDTEVTKEDISHDFNPTIAALVDGVTKLAKMNFSSKLDQNLANTRKIITSITEDVRIIIIKLADRLHNMRTLESQPANKQYKIAGETLYIYAPLANRLGLNKVKSELENLSFKFEHPDEYTNISKKLETTQKQREKLFDEFTKPIRAALDNMHIQYELKQRVKTPYSIWNKMQNKHVTFEEIYDILALRIIFTPRVREEEVNECFNIYVAISRIYKSHPDRMRDWLSHPKANGYQALHVTLMSKTGQWIEVQIRSDRMDEVAEQGFAAHWKYKDGLEDEEYTEDEAELNDWLRTIKEILDDPQPDAMDFLDTIKLNLFASEIFVFTPKGEIKTMPTGCTALDFAFSIHTFLGSHCIGAKVNHKLVPLSHKLKSGDQVEILTSKSQHVSPAWINFVSTAKAKAKIQAILRRDNREVQKKGEEILMDFLQKNQQEYTPAAADRLAEFHDIRKRNDFFIALGEKRVLLGEKDIDELTGKNKKDDEKGGWLKYVPFVGNKKKKEESQKELFVVPDKFNRKKPIFITEDNISQYKFPGCCHPIPGDDALGYIDNKNQIEIHKRNCPVAAKLKTSFGNRILDIKWDMHKTLYFDATIRLGGIDRLGLLNEVTQIISAQMNVNIHTVNITCEEGIFDGSIELRVHDRDDVKTIINNLKGIPDLKEISQIM